MNSKIIDKITKLSLSKNNDYYAIHGTSFELIENLVFTGKISNGGNFDNYFYLLIDPNSKGVNIEEAALFYANVNAVKDYIKEKFPDLFNKISSNNFDPYLYTTSIGSLMSLTDGEDVPKYFNFLSEIEIEQIKNAILETKKEDRQGILLKFSSKLKDIWKIPEPSSAGQTKILLKEPLTIDCLSSIELLGEYEKQQLKLLAE